MGGRPVSVPARALVVAFAVVAALLVPRAAGAQTAEDNAAAELFASENMRHVSNLTYELNYPDSETLPYGTDIEFATLTVPGDVVGATVDRLAGPQRIATAAAVSRSTFDAAESVVVATAETYADALAGAPLAASLDAPLLLSGRDGLATDAAEEIERLGATRAILLGGPTALAPQVEQDLTDLDVEVRRLGGADRFATAGLVFDELGGANEVLVAEGEHVNAARGWPDALSASALGAAQRMPVLLVNAERLPDATRDRLAADTAVTIVGGTASVSSDVEEELDAAAGAVSRLAGDDRYATSALAARASLDRGASAAAVYLATGRDFADGLVAGAAAGADGGILLLVDGQDLARSAATTAVLEERRADLREVHVVGGIVAISAAVEDAVRALVAPAGGAAEDGTEEGSAPPPDDEQVTPPDADPGLDQGPGGGGDPVTGPPADVEPGEVREFAIAGSEFNGMQIIDITNPEAVRQASNYDCGTLQGDVQVFRRGDRTFATFASEDTSALIVESRCVQDAVAAGDVVFEDADGDGAPDDRTPAYGTYVVEITNPYDPVYGGFIPVPEGSHNGTVDPSGRYFYNSNSSLIVNPVTSGGQETTAIEYYDISDLDNVRRLGELQLPIRPGVGTESHDITFSADGARAYSAALSQTVIIDTTDPANPAVISNFEDPAINVEHQADPIDVVASDGTPRRLLVVEDELAGAAGNGFCPGGGLHVYDVTGENELNPQVNKVGAYYIPQFRPAGTGSGQGESVTCTAHVFRMYPEQGIMTIAWYNAGVWVLDISGLADLATGPVATPISALGFAYFSNSDTWAFKTNRFEEDGSFYGYGNDINRGLDVYRFDASIPATVEGGSSLPTGTWVGQAEAVRRAPEAAAAARASGATVAGADLSAELLPPRFRLPAQDAGA